MNREIKFRGKRTNNGEWVYGSFVLDAADNPRIACTDEKKDGLIFNHAVPDTVGQFTGLHDKNGKEIYEGDILRVDTGYDIRHTHVSFDTERGRWHRMEDYSIGVTIGNIHENPELLAR